MSDKGSRIFFGLVFLGIGAGLLGFRCAPRFWHHETRKSWVESACVITRAAVIAQEGDSDGFKAEVAYRYKVNGIDRAGCQLLPGEDIDKTNRSQAQVIAFLYPEGSDRRCLSNPARLDESVLENKPPHGLLKESLISLIFVAAGISILTGKGPFSKNRSSPGNQRSGQLVGLVFGLVFLGVGGAILYATVFPAHRGESSWVRTPATIEAVDWAGDTRSSGKHSVTFPAFDVSFRYVAGGREHRVKIEKLKAGESFQGKSTLSVLRAGAPVECFVNPADPSRAVLEPVEGSSDIMGWVVGGLFAIPGAMLIIGMLRGGISGSGGVKRRGGEPFRKARRNRG